MTTTTTTLAKLASRCAVLSVLFATPAVAANTVKTGDGLALVLAEDGRITSVAVDHRALPAEAALPFNVEECLVPDGRRTSWGVVPGTARTVDGGVRFSGTHSNAALSVEAAFSVPEGSDHVSIDGTIRDLTGRDRALWLTVRIPLNLAGWRWENTAFRAADIEAGTVYPTNRADVLYLDRVGPRQGQDPMRSGLPINKTPHTAVVGPDAALALACPTHEPRAFLVQAGADGLSIRYTLGLSPATRHHPSSATFRAILYRVDPAWGIRSASERYQAFFPELFASTNRKHGNSTIVQTFNPRYPETSKWPDNTADFGFQFAENDFQWTNGELRPKAAEAIARLGLIPFHWRGPWYYFHGVERGITLPAQLALLKAQAEGRAPGAHGKNNQLCGCPDEISAKGAYNSYLVNESGRLDRGHYPKGYGCYLMGMNMNPDLPRPNRASLALDWQYRFIKRWDEPGFRGPRNFAWDALDDWGGYRRLNFRREHFAYERVPLVFDAESGRLCILNGFTHWAFARFQSGLVRAKGGLIMCNANLEEAMMFCGPFIDVVFKERPASRWDDERLSVERMLAGPKPICFIAGRQPEEGPDLEATVRMLLLFGAAPGSRGTEGQRELMKQYMPVLRTMAEAGWQPVTHARADGLQVERFGTGPGPVYFAVANRAKEAVAGTLRIDLDALGLSASEAAGTAGELVEGRSLRTSRKGEALVVALQVKAGETLVVRVGE